jgi:hypothetical protein
MAQETKQSNKTISQIAECIYFQIFTRTNTLLHQNCMVACSDPTELAGIIEINITIDELKEISERERLKAFVDTKLKLTEEEEESLVAHPRLKKILKDAYEKQVGGFIPQLIDIFNDKYSYSLIASIVDKDTIRLVTTPLIQSKNKFSWDSLNEINLKNLKQNKMEIEKGEEDYDLRFQFEIDEQFRKWDSNKFE